MEMVACTNLNPLGSRCPIHTGITRVGYKAWLRSSGARVSVSRV